MSDAGCIMYVCSECAEHNPEGCGHYNPKDLVVMPDGRWLCDGCYDEEPKIDLPPFSSLPSPPIHKPA